jgi:sugar porter (SP) family MFS transporter
MDKQQNSGFVYIVVAFAAIGGILFGLDQNNWAGAIEKPKFVENFCGKQAACSDAEALPQDYVWFIATAGALVQFGAIFGAVLIAPVIAGRLGRRESLSAGCLLVIVGLVPTAFTVNVALFMVARAVAGVGVGVVTYTLPMFISEVAPKEVRGMLGVSMQFMAVIGGVIPYVLLVNPWFGYSLSFLLPVVPGVILMFGIFFFPRSPRFALLSGLRRGLPVQGEARAKESLRRLRGSDAAAEAELSELRDSLMSEQVQAPWSTLFTDRSIRRRVLIASGIQWMQQFTGVNALLSYGPAIFQSAGVPLEGLTATLVQNIFGIVGVVVMMLTIDRLGRRFLFLLGAAGMAVTLGAAALFTYLLNQREDGDPARTTMGWLVLACVYTYFVFFQVGWGGTSWVYPSEIYPMDVKERALSISVCMQWLANFVIAEIVPAQVKLLHADGTFLFYAVCCLVSFGLVYAFVPETKGVALEDMDEIFGRGSGKGRGFGKKGEVDSDAGNSSEASAQEPATSAREGLGEAVPEAATHHGVSIAV